MASGAGAPGAPPAVTAAQQAGGAVRLRFCKESNDLLYPREDRARKTLVFACRNCDYVEDAGEEAEDFCVYRNIIDHSAAEKTVIVTDVRADATLPRTRDVICPKCAHREAVFFSTTTAEGMTLFFQCLLCIHKWQDVV
jgi:DNA-directed RNA polymerase II subunit RPB9